LLSVPAQALNITYTFDSSFDGQSSVSQTVGGVTGTFFGINRNSGSDSGKFSATANGIFLDSPEFAGNQFNISFNQAVKFLSYGVTKSFIASGRTATFDLSNPNGTGSTGNNLASVGTFNLNNQFTLSAGQTSTLTASLSNPILDTAQIQSITVDYTPTAVPWETDALPVVGSTILFGLGVWGKRKFAKPLQK
jgi:hypothetical protein